MANVDPTRIVSSANSAPMTTAFLTAVRASGVTRSAAGYVVDASGVAHACYVDASGNWNLTTTLTSGVPIDAQTFADLRTSPAPYVRALVSVNFVNATHRGICIAADPTDPPDPG